MMCHFYLADNLVTGLSGLSMSVLILVLLCTADVDPYVAYGKANPNLNEKKYIYI